MASEESTTSDILIRAVGACGRITLNRPRAINALNTPMVQGMQTALTAWADDPSIAFVLVDGAGDRGLCAGGDIRALYNAIVAGQMNLATEFFRSEYQLNHFIARYRKPYVVLMDGIVMGGGIGISSHGSHRIVTERSQLAMPETAIGFVPDVGGTYLLATALGEFGTFMGLTGSRVGAADGIRCGLADQMVRGEDLLALARDIEACTDVAAMEQCLRGYVAEPPPGMTAERRAWIDECFTGSTVEEIIAALHAHPDRDAQTSAAELAKLSPTSLKLTLQALRQARIVRDLAASLQQEFRFAQLCTKGHDLVEGIRAAVVDKDRNPRWSPARLEEVTPAMVESYFNDPASESLDLPVG